MTASLPFADCKVLVVEDEPIQALALEQMMRELGCTVIGPAGSTAEAAELLERERPNVALLDMVLQDGLALPLVRRLAEAEVPFAVVTGCDRMVRDHPLLLGVPVLQKPYSPPRLRASVRQLYRIDRTRALAETERRIATTWSRIQAQAGLVGRLAAQHHDTRLAEDLLQTHEQSLAALQARRAHLLRELERQGGPAVPPGSETGLDVLWAARDLR